MYQTFARSRPRALLVCAIGLALGVLSATVGQAADHFLVIGGGSTPSYNQVSLEKNVLFVQGILKDFGVRPSNQDYFFGDGTLGGRDVQLRNAEPIPHLNELLSEILDRGDGWEMQYRAHQIPALRGANSRQSLADWFDRIGSKLPENDRLILYYTGHGGAGGKQARNTNFALWNDRSMSVREFTGLLDKVPPKVQVDLIMVQCHSGGFADVIFKGAQSGANISSLSDSHRCGFFATVPERPAAGCTPDIRVEDYREYSTYFWAALCGHSRTGERVDVPDFDRDGRVSLAEAHAYVQLNSKTIDIPVCTSEIFLRALSRTKPTTGEQLFSAHTSFDRLRASATPAQQAVLQGLSEELRLYGPDRADAAQREAMKVQKEKETVDGDKSRLSKDFEGLRSRIASSLTRRWPELSSPWHPRVPDLLREEGEQIANAIETNPSYAQFQKVGGQLSKAEERSLDLERRWAKCQRFMRLCETVALAANLPKIAPGNVQERYRQLVAQENGTLHWNNEGGGPRAE